MEESVVTKIKIDTIYSEEIGMYVAEFHYRFEKELGLGINPSTGEPSEIYSKVAIEYKEPIPQDKLKSWHISRAPLSNVEGVNEMTGAELKYIIPISREEYENSINE